MKKTIILLFTGLLSFGVSAQSFGLKGGVAMSTLSGDESDAYIGQLLFLFGAPAELYGENIEPEMIIGPMLGAFMQFGDGSIKYTIEATYSKKGAKYNHSLPVVDPQTLQSGTAEIEAEISASYLDLGIMGNFHITDELSINAGPYLGIRLNWNHEASATIFGQNYNLLSELNTLYPTTDFEGDDDIQRTEFGGNMGMSYWVNDMLGIDFRYCMGFTNLSDEDDIEFFTGTMQLGVNYLFSY